MWKSHKGKVIGGMEHGSFEEKMTSLAPIVNCCDIKYTEFKCKHNINLENYRNINHTRSHT